MNQEDIIRMAREACPYTTDEMRGAFYEGFLKGAVAEREACAYRASIALLGADRGLANRVDKAIRARGQALEQPEPEPVIDKSAAIRIATSLGWTPKREWVGLTDEEIDEGQRQSWVEKQAFESAVWWAEAKLKEKNT